MYSETLQGVEIEKVVAVVELNTLVVVGVIERSDISFAVDEAVYSLTHMPHCIPLHLP
jgi:hypothetical protein